MAAATAGRMRRWTGRRVSPAPVDRTPARAAAWISASTTRTAAPAARPVAPAPRARLGRALVPRVRRRVATRASTWAATTPTAALAAEPALRAAAARLAPAAARA